MYLRGLAIDIGGCLVYSWLQTKLFLLDMPATLWHVIEVDKLRLKLFMLISICQGHLLLFLLYVIVLELFLCNLSVNPFLCRIMLSCTSTLATYSYVDGVMRNAEIEEVSKKIELWQLDSWRICGLHQELMFSSLIARKLNFKGQRW